MTQPRAAAPRRIGRWIAAVLAIVALAGAGAVGLRWWQDNSADAPIVGTRVVQFPDIDRSALDPVQARLVSVLEREFDHPGTGPTYAEGVTEPWCADFVSWVMREAGAPLANPNSGSWRIPGVYTLQEYYQGAGRFAPIASGYQPRTGDVLLYNDPSPFHQHTNIVLTARDGTVTTIGGNELGGIRIHRFALADDSGIVGFGRL
ncbi:MULTISPECIES: CHAP domain-containing protein [unclassified Nocardia]|uniref:CHAP domain-containing protein n=1 Tax=unclassified Nocardia TaxID=2637762 RepID=UPI001CE4561D|nr:MULTISPECIES: CHAP domain-containing protein [unclassified Nocardia]